MISTAPWTVPGLSLDDTDTFLNINLQEVAVHVYESLKMLTGGFKEGWEEKYVWSCLHLFSCLLHTYDAEKSRTSYRISHDSGSAV